MKVLQFRAYQTFPTQQTTFVNQTVQHYLKRIFFFTTPPYPHRILTWHRNGGSGRMVAADGLSSDAGNISEPSKCYSV